MGRNTYRLVLGEPMATASSGRSLLVLPPELWHKILRSLRTCFQFSWFFHEMAQHLLFGHVTIYFGVDFDVDPADRLTAQQMTARSEQAERTREILRHIGRNIEFAQIVRTITVRARAHSRLNPDIRKLFYGVQSGFIRYT